MQRFVSSTEQKNGGHFVHGALNWWKETFTFLKYKYGENIVLNIEIG